MTAYLNALGVLCALGNGCKAVSDGLFAGDTRGMVATDGWIPGRCVPVGRVPDDLPPTPPGLEGHDTRNNRLLLAAAQQIEGDIQRVIQRYGAGRVGVVLGTSTSGIDESSCDIAEHRRTGQLPDRFDYRHQELCAPAEFLADWLSLGGPAYVISTACTSGGRALQSARRLLAIGLCDAVLCGGVDSLCGLTLNGFTALEAMSDSLCKPLSRNRDGINIGEAAALFVMTREQGNGPAIALLGAGASSDAHHISAPEPNGRGAREAMQKALDDAKLHSGDIAYVNLHGTSTPHNDAMESLALASLFPAGVPCSSTKPLTGHTLGAAGALEAAFCWLTLAQSDRGGMLPPHIWDGAADETLPPLEWTRPGTRLHAKAPRCLMSNSFAFGGNNISLIIGEP